jgi:hypothetical protein
VVRPDVHRLRLAGVDPAALAKLRRHEPAARPAVLNAVEPHSLATAKLVGRFTKIMTK